MKEILRGYLKHHKGYCSTRPKRSQLWIAVMDKPQHALSAHRLVC
jgi:hypothetical protein